MSDVANKVVGKAMSDKGRTGNVLGKMTAGGNSKAHSVVAKIKGKKDADD